MKRDLGALGEREHDLLIVGGGIYGATAAWDAAQRGLQVALVETDDFCSQVSWNSLKTIHGGLRYLQTADLRRLRHSVRERRTLLAIAPELVRPLAFLVPAYGHGRHGPEVLRLGLAASDCLSYDRNYGLPPEQRLPRSRRLSRGEMLERLPGLPAAGLTGGGSWFDAQVRSSERLVLAFLHAAAGAGAALANHAEVTGWVKAKGRVCGALVKDHIGGGEFEVRARLVLCAAGSGIHRLWALAGIERPPSPLLRAMNLVLRRPIVSGAAVGTRSRGRFLFAVPWEGRSIVGTAYGPAGEPSLLWSRFFEEAARAFPWADLKPEDVTLVHSGLVPGAPGRLAARPLIVDHDHDHDHGQADAVPGLLSVLGVKYTTARGVVERAVDLVFRRLGRLSPPCRTAELPLPEARLLAGPLEEAVQRAIAEEMALSLSDLVLRRLDLGTAGPPPEGALQRVAASAAAALAWSPERTREELGALAEFYRRGRPSFDPDAV